MRATTEPLTPFMDNVLASRLGKVARAAGTSKRTDVGDDIDRGLILLRLLEDDGFSLTKTVGKPKKANNGYSSCWKLDG